MIIVGIIIKLDSPGPIFYYQNKKGKRVYRLGKNSKPFPYFKFRSMYVGSEEATKFGCFIRRWHLDELPELLLVLNGSMSLVGPRPWTRDFLIKIENKKKFYDSMKAKPGITGPFQISRKEKSSIDYVIFLNNWYAENQGFITDTKIILKTIPAIMKQKVGIHKTLLVL
jgi:lipopolysaccharide/colanic/teichoic acid biosynthesis glycosyltransferase